MKLKRIFSLEKNLENFTLKTRGHEFLEKKMVFFPCIFHKIFWSICLEMNNCVLKNPMTLQNITKEVKNFRSDTMKQKRNLTPAGFEHTTPMLAAQKSRIQ